jgi:tetratricopeptide (TPR) repeat protein
VSLLTRALDLLPADHLGRANVLIGLTHASGMVGDFELSREAAQALIQLGSERGDARMQSNGRVQAMWIRLQTDPTATMDEAQEIAQAAISILEEAGDQAGLARAFHLLSQVHHFRSRSEEHLQTLELARAHASRAGDIAHEAEIMAWLGVEYYFGSTPVEHAEPKLEQILAEARAKSLLPLEGITLSFLGGVEGLRGHFDQARETFGRGRAILAEIGLRTWIAGQTQVMGYVEMLAADYAAAEREFRFGYEEYERMGETGVRSLNAAMLAEALYEQGRDDESERYVQLSRDLAADDDVASQVAWRAVKARLLARRDEVEDAERMARQAVGYEGGDTVLTADIWSGLGEVLALAGKEEEAKEAFAHAVQLHEHKGNIAGAARTRDLAARLGV